MPKNLSTDLLLHSRQCVGRTLKLMKIMMHGPLLPLLFATISWWILARGSLYLSTGSHYSLFNSWNSDVVLSLRGSMDCSRLKKWISACIFVGLFAKPVRCNFIHRIRDVPFATTSIASSPPQIWVGQGTVDCGAPFASEQCLLTSTLSQAFGYTYLVSYLGDKGVLTTITSQEYDVVAFKTIYYTMTQLTDFEGEITYTYFQPCDGADCSTVLVPDTFYTLLVPNYSPTAIYSTYTPTPTTSILGSPATATSSLAIKRRGIYSIALETSVPDSIAPMNTPLPESSLKIQKRNAQGNSCQAAGGIGTVDTNYETNDLTQVCRFIGSYAEVFISLAPTPAAFMPTWIDYLVSLIVCVYQAVMFTSNDNYPKQPKTSKLVFGLIGVGIALIRLITAIVRIANHANDDFKALPFISPSLWVDWLVILEFNNRWSRIVEAVTGLIAFAVYIVCFWLCIGYGSLGYGTEQYYILSVPEECQFRDVQWQTDPRRVHFLRFHIIIFAFASFVAAYLALFIDGGEGRRPLWKMTVDEVQSEMKAQTRLRKYCIFLSLVLPNLAGVLCAGILNRYSYLLFSQQNCWASYVSGRFGYVDIEFHDWTRRIATWIGLNT
jgi:hypothetical protein